MTRKPVERMADTFTVTREQRSFLHRRTAFLLKPQNDGPNRSLADLLANAYHQGLEDAMQVLQDTGRLAWTQSAPAQQDGWA